MIIDYKKLQEYGAKLRDDYIISGVPLENAFFQGVRRSGFVLLNQKSAMKEISLNLVFEGSGREEIDQKKSMLDGILLGTNELVLDGFFYKVICNHLGEAQYKGECLCTANYSFVGVKHKELRSVIGNTVYCESTLPYTDCILSVITSKSAATYKLGTVTFKNVTKGDRLVVDGINGRILINDAPAAQRADWIRFPTLVPGMNDIDCIDIVTAEYYPVYF